jgi:fumigallin biosynthesis monooxygenase-like protein
MGVFAGRHGVDVDGDFVVFLIGMRFNRPWRVRSSLRVFAAMPPMVRELRRNPQSGFLHAEFGFMYGGPALVQFWRSFEQLDRFARDPDARHLRAWKAFNQRVRDSGDVGIWHETYRVHAGESEAIYNNMPRVGLGAVGEHRPLGATSTAPLRIGAQLEDRAPIRGY